MKTWQAFFYQWREKGVQQISFGRAFSFYDSPKPNIGGKILNAPSV